MSCFFTSHLVYGSKTEKLKIKIASTALATPRKWPIAP